MTKALKSWCESDEHSLFDYFADFNEWLDSGDEANDIRDKSGLTRVSNPSKALFAGDRNAYEQVFREYRIQRRHEVLSGQYIEDTFGDDHWFERNEQRLDQLVSCLIDNSVVPFIGAGVSVSGGFPTWKDHLRQQGKTAGIDAAVIEAHLAKGEFEAVIETIETTRGLDVFAQEIRDAFSKTGKLEAMTLLISELFSDTLITTNYDRLLEQAYDIGPGDEVQVINGTTAMENPEPDKVTVIKLHGDIQSPNRCILGKKQYDEAYGETDLDLTRPIPKLLRYHYTTSSLLFIGCSLNNDRTIQVFKAVKDQLMTHGDVDLPEHFSIEQAPDDLKALEDRNAELLKLGIVPIWFPTGEYDKVEAILRHARNEVNYKERDKPRENAANGSHFNEASSAVASPYAIEEPSASPSPSMLSRITKLFKVILHKLGIGGPSHPMPCDSSD